MDKNNCGPNTDCEDTTGYACVPTDNETGCENINECDAHGENDCHAWTVCTDLVQLYSCTDGYSGNSLTCADVDECDVAYGGNDCSNGANSECNNIDGNYYCTCADGYYSISDDKSVCADIDNGADGTHTCNVDTTCTNTDGGCECACKEGFDGEGYDMDLTWAVLILTDVQ